MRFQVLMLVRAATEIEATSQAEAERLAEKIAVHGALVLSLSDGGAPPKFMSGSVDEVEVVDVDEAAQ